MTIYLIENLDKFIKVKDAEDMQKIMNIMFQEAQSIFKESANCSYILSSICDLIIFV